MTPPPLEIRDYTLTSVATGLSARNVRELRERFGSAPDRSLFHHFWGRLLRCEPTSGEFGNDFAEWAAGRLKDLVLAERLALVDPAAFGDVASLREQVCELLDQRCEETEVPVHETTAEEAFHFVSDQTTLYQTEFRPEGPEELRELLDELPDTSLFLHFVWASNAVDGAPVESAPAWIRGFGSEWAERADALEAIDVFLMSTPELAERVRRVFE